MANKIDNFDGSRGFFAWQPAAWLRVSGEDAMVFLQGQLSNDLRSLGATGAVYGLWLNHKGRVMADGFVHRAGVKDFWVGSYFSSAVELRSRLEAFVIADDVTIEDCTADWAGVTLLGAGAEGVSNEGLLGLGGVEFSGRRDASPVREWVFPRGVVVAVREALSGFREVSAGEMERRRIRARIPAVPMDLGPADLPNEGGLEDGAISYTKGCYLGQEVMARLKSMGQVRRRLLRVRGEGAVPALPSDLFQGGRKLGELRTAVATEGAEGFVGLALVSLLSLRADESLSFSTAAERGGAVWLLDLP